MAAKKDYQFGGRHKAAEIEQEKEGKRGVSSPSSAPDPSIENMFAENSRKDVEKIQKRTSSPASSSSSTAPRTSSDFIIRPGGYEHPWSDAPCNNTIEAITPHSGIPIDTIAFQTIDTLQSSLTETQVFLDEFLKESHLGVGGYHEGVGGLKEV